MEITHFVLKLMQILYICLGCILPLLGIVFLVLKIKKIIFQNNRNIIWISLSMIVFGVCSLLSGLYLVNYSLSFY